MNKYRISEISEILDVSPDTVRRWIDAGRLPASRSSRGHRQVAGPDLAAFVSSDHVPSPRRQSARNRFPGIITRVERDRVAAKVELYSGGRRLVSLLTREAADDLGLEPGARATAVVKATNVIIEL